MPKKGAVHFYLRDLGQLIGRMALEAREEYRSARGSSNDGYLLGRLAGFHDVISLMQDQAEAFGIDLSELSLESIDPVRDLT